jgi:hypothetical protein
LATIGMDSIRYIKIKDTARIVATLPKDHKYYVNPPILTGFDLDAVVILHNVPINADDALLYIVEDNGRYLLSYADGTKINMYNVLGNEIILNDSKIINHNNYSIGVYILVARRDGKVEAKKIVINGYWWLFLKFPFYKGVANTKYLTGYVL